MAPEDPPGVPKERNWAPQDLPGTPKGSKTSPEGGENLNDSHHIPLGKGAKQQRMSLWGRGQNNNACPFREGGKTTTHVTLAGRHVNFLLSPCSIHPAKNHRMRRSRVASPIIHYK